MQVLPLFKIARCHAAFSSWAKVPMGPADPILGVAAAFKKDTNPAKVNLSIGAYRDNKGSPVVLGSVQKAQRFIVDNNLDNEYLPVEGLVPYLEASKKLAFGGDFYKARGNHIAACHCLSGTGSVRLGFQFLARFQPGQTIYIPDPTWPNHLNIARDSNLPFKLYRYFNPKTKGVDFDGLMQDINKMEKGSAVLFHACAHNPTGCDLTLDQWKLVRDQVQKRNLLAFFDMAYQGFTSGDINVDAQGVRLFADSGLDMLVCQSYAKNMGLYGQRTGALNVVCENNEEMERVLSQLRLLARPLWSNPPLHGARIADRILNTPELYNLWLGEVKDMATRISSMRSSLVSNLKQLGSPHDWSHIRSQIGMFAFTGLNADHVKRLIDEYHIYLLSSGRISMAGLNEGNVGYVAKAFDAVTRNSKI